MMESFVRLSHCFPVESGSSLELAARQEVCRQLRNTVRYCMIGAIHHVLTARVCNTVFVSYLREKDVVAVSIGKHDFGDLACREFADRAINHFNKRYEKKKYRV